MSSRAALVALACGVAVVAPARDAAAGDPETTWWTIETDHFVIHYYDPLGDVARRVAEVGERAHEILAPALGRDPDEKTQVVILDDTDGANGFASVLPRNRITLYATAPGGDSSLNDHDDWLYGLTAHEYTHILHLDSIGGLPKLVNRVLGKTWAPNQVQPRWVIEGLATYEETKRSSSGRARSSQFDMFVRVAVLEDRDLDLDAVTSGPYEFPRGNAAYLYGSKFLEYVFDRHGDDTARAMSWAHGHNPIPFAINRQIHKATGQPFTELWTDWKDWLRDKYALQLEVVERTGRREGRRLTFDTESNLSPRYSEDGKELVYFASDGTSAQRLRAIPIGGNIGDAVDLLELDRAGGWDLMSDGSVVFEQTHPHRRDYDFQDLMYWDRPTGKLTRLTRGARARDPAVSPDGRQVAFSINGESTSKLAVIPLVADATPKVIWEGERFEQAFQPAWSPDGTRIAFSAWRRGGWRDILVLEVATGAITEITDDRAIDGDPEWSPDGAYLFFSSDRTGIYDVYAHQLSSGALWQVTNVVGGAFDPAVSPDGTLLAYHGFDVGGYDLFELPLDPAQWTPAQPYLDDRPAPTAIEPGETVVTGPRPYRAIETLGPQAWSAELAADSVIGNAVTLRTSGGDAAGIHGWSLGTTISLDDGAINVGLSYGYSKLRLPVRLSLARSMAHRNGFRVDGVSRAYTDETLSSTLSFSLPTRRTPDSSLSFSGDLDADYFRMVDPPDTTPDPNDLLPRGPNTDYFQAGLALRGAWSNVRGYAEVLGPIEGQEANGSIRLDHPALGARFRTLTLSWSWRGYWKLPIAPTSAIGVRYAGGLRVGDIDRGSSFGLGGTPEQDVASALIGTARVASTGYLRGYEPRVIEGDQFHLVNLEYRHKLWQIERGLATLPIYFRRLHVAALVDGGAAYDGDVVADDVKVSVGGALRLDAVFGYFAPGSFEVGYARGLSSEGIDETWLLMTTTL